MSGIASALRYAECHEEVTRKGEVQPCEGIAVAVRFDGEGGFYPVCSRHTRSPMVRLGDVFAAALTTAASAIEARRNTYVQSGGLPELIPSNHADAERLGHLDGLAAAAEIVRALAAPQTPDARR